MRRLRRPVAVVAVVMLLLQMLAVVAVAEAPANDHFERTWERTDQPVAAGRVSRTWMWGPDAFTQGMTEDYAESPNGERQVQYFDKSRMEITNPGGDSSSIWYVTNGLLVVEMMTGQMQTGNSSWETRLPAEVNVAGDSDDLNGPTYATFALLSAGVPADVGATVTERVDRAGIVSDDPGLASHQVTLANFVPDTGHHVASVFRDFMRADGLVYENGSTATAALFPNPYYATGFPIAEPYWAMVLVGGTAKDVLMQCFERRCLTYTPGNPEGWQVEAGNVGQHYYAWRYSSQPAPLNRMPYIHQPSGGTSTIYTMNPDGTDRQPMSVPANLILVDLSLSGDGQTVAFVAFDDTSSLSNASQVYTISIDGSNLRQVTAPQAERLLQTLEWSPDGTSIAFISLELNAAGDRHQYLYTINPDGSSEQRLSDDNWPVTAATWAPDGATIVYATNRDCVGYEGCLWIMNADGSNTVKFLEDHVGNLQSLDWSPDWSEIIYLRTDYTSSPAIAQIMAAPTTGGFVRLVHEGPYMHRARWDPSGNWVFFDTSHDSGDTHIYRIDRDGTNLESITSDAGYQRAAAPAVR